MSQLPVANKSLGRGLAALLGPSVSDTSDPSHQHIHFLSVKEMIPGRYQPRETFDQESLDSLIASIKEKGVIQPILVRPIHQGLANYEIVAGERRWRATQEAGFLEIPALIKEMSDLEALETGLIENIQRHDLNPLEEAQGFKRLMDEFHYTQEDLARALGKSRSHVANSVRLLSLPDEIKLALKEARITTGHARALINTTLSQEILSKVIRGGLNVRQTEKLVQKTHKSSKEDNIHYLTDPRNKTDLESLIQKISEKMNLKVTIDLKSNNSGILNLHFQNLEQLDRLLSNISVAA